MPPGFIKFHGFGNDYIVIEASQLVGIGNLGEFAQEICDRHYGAGADGIAVVSPAADGNADYQVRIFNPDGSEASLSGNGTRCAAGYLHYKQLWTRAELRVSTKAGIKRYKLQQQVAPGKYVFESELGQPKFDSKSIPMLTDQPMDKVVDYPVDVDGERVSVTALQMGNPNCCIFVDDFEQLDWRRIGKLLENHHQFPERTNVVFVRVDNRQTISLRIWERGVGETTASGTCSCAAAVAAMLQGQTDKAIEVLMPGGKARIQWRADTDGEVVITGSTEVIYGGDWLR